MIILIIVFAIIGIACTGAAVFVTISLILYGWKERRMKKDDYGDCANCKHIVVWEDRAGYEHYGCSCRKDIVDNGFCPDYEVKE